MSIGSVRLRRAAARRGRVDDLRGAVGRRRGAGGLLMGAVDAAGRLRAAWAGAVGFARTRSTARCAGHLAAGSRAVPPAPRWSLSPNRSEPEVLDRPP